MEMLSNEQLAKILLDSGYLEKEDLDRAVHIATETGSSLESVLTEKEILPDEHLGQVIASELNIPFVNLRVQSVADEVLNLLPESFAEKNNVIAFHHDKDGIHIAMHDPKDVHLIQMLKKKLGSEIVVHFATMDDLHLAYHRYKKDLDKKILVLAKEALDPNLSNDEDVSQDTKIIDIVDLLFDFAYSSKSSDMHIEPQDVDTVIRFRIDGVLKDVVTIPKTLHERLITRLKILSRLRTDEHMAAQDGHLKYNFADEDVDVRVSIVPTTFGEKVVLRLLSEKARQYSVDALGLSLKDQETVNEQAKKPWGMILVTGPTGSGKTTTLYALIKIMNSREVNISTIEDPVEYSISGVNQIQVNNRTELTFASGLRSIVRQDPDIIMVGEIRDKETADIAINAALTGHLLLSTLHTNDAATALPRLVDMGVQPFLVASTVNAVVAQRLVRKICMKCIESYSVTVQSLEDDGYVVPDSVKKKIFANKSSVELYKGAGCALCNNTGYFDRVGVFEILEIDPEVRNLILSSASSDEIRNYAVSKGMTTMFDDALDKVLQGVTTIEEVLRVVRE